jgi:hypothetical protein
VIIFQAPFTFSVGMENSEFGIDPEQICHVYGTDMEWTWNKE